MNQACGNEIILNVLEIRVELIESETKYIKIVISFSIVSESPLASLHASFDN